jgi:CyaY protein
MDESEFTKRADATLQRLADAIEAADVDADCSFKGDGVLEVDLDDGGRLIINRHGAAREIWVAARSGGYHFRPSDDRWTDTRDGSELFASVARLLTEQLGRPVSLG